MESVIVTGADGFIGSNLVKYLLSKELDVYAIVIKNSATKSRIDCLDKIHIIEANSEDYDKITNLLPKGALAFFHLAWAGVSPEGRNDLQLQINNIEIALKAVKLAAELKSQKFIIPGSTMEYTDCGGVINEDSLPNPQNAYGAAKLSAKYLCALACEKLNIQYIYTVISSIYSSDRRDNNVIYYTISKLLDNQKPSFTKLEQIWDYVHIDDVVNALYLISINNISKSFYTIGHGDNCPLSDYIYRIRNLINPNIPLGIGEIPYKNNKIPRSCVNIAPLTEDTGYIPRISFDEGIKDVINEIIKERKGS